MIVEAKHQPVPHAINIAQSFGTERIVDTNTGEQLAAGTVILAKATVAEFRNWLRPHGPVWTTTSPMLGDWTQEEFGEPK